MEYWYDYGAHYERPHLSVVGQCVGSRDWPSGGRASVRLFAIAAGRELPEFRPPVSNLRAGGAVAGALDEGIVASAEGGPIYAEGEEVKWVRVASAPGGPSTVTHIAAVGREIPAELIVLRE